MDWENLYKVFLQYLKEHLEALEKSTEEFTQDFINYLQKNGYQITPEMEKMIDDFAKSQAEAVMSSVNQVIGSVVAAATDYQKTKSLPTDNFVKSIARKIFEEKYADGFNLSERIWDWENELKEGLKKVVSDGVKRGIGVNKLVYEMQYKIERLTRTQYKNVLAEETPRWLKQLEDAARGYIKNPEMKEVWEETVKQVEKHINQLSRKGTYTASKTAFNKILKAVEKGNQELINKAVKWWTYDKQLYRLKVISQTEQARAYHLTQIEITKDNPYIVGYQWRLSRSHPRPDICDVYANVDYGLGKGVFPKDKVPRQKAHPLCLCYLLPKAERKGMKEKEKPEIPENVLRSFAPEYMKDLEASGIKINELFDFELGAFRRKKDLMKIPEFKPLQSIGRVKRKGRWKKVNVKGLEKSLKKKLKNIPKEVEEYVKGKDEIDSLMEHFFKRKYLPDEPIRPEKPKDLNRWIKEVLSDENSVVFESFGRYIIVSDKFGVVIEPPDKKISVYGLRGDIGQWKKENKWQQELGTINFLKKRLLGN